jgi:hypothetical protein
MFGGSEMREFIGHKMNLTVQEKGDVEGIMVSENKSFLFLKEGDGRIHRYAKGKVIGFVPLDCEPVNFVPFHLLRCINKKTGCPGVQFIQEGAGFKPTDFETFMGPCECRADTCDFGTKGELRTVDGKFLKEMFKNVLFGDYPEGKEAKSGRSTRTDETPGDVEESSGRAGEGEIPVDGGTGSDDETVGGTGEEMQ